MYLSSNCPLWDLNQVPTVRFEAKRFWYQVKSPYNTNHEYVFEFYWIYRLYELFGLNSYLSVVDVLLDTLKSTDPFSASEALVFCIGSLKLLTGNATIVKQLVKKDCIENLAILLNSINKTVSQAFFFHTLASAVKSSKVLVWFSKSISMSIKFFRSEKVVNPQLSWEIF